MILRAMIFLLASAAAGGAAWLSTQIGTEPATAQVEVRAERMPTADVLVAVVDITSGDILSPDKLGWEAWPQQNLNERFITREKRPEAVQELAGTFVNNGFVAGEPIREARLMAANKNLLSNKIEPGKRAAAVKVSAESAVGGFVLPGDRVDVIHTVTLQGVEPSPARNESRIIISNARVLAIDQISAQTPEGTVVGKTATLELSPQDAERIMAAEASGMLSLALRSISDHADATVIRREEPAKSVQVHRRGATQTITIE